MSKVKTMSEALDLIQDGAVVATTGFVHWALPDEVFKAVEDRFLETGHPANLECVFTGSAGLNGTGYDRWGHKGLIGKVIAGHIGLTPNIPALINANECQAYNYPLGVIAELFRCSIQGRNGLMTKVGLRTFVDPRLEGGKMNAVTTEDLVKVVEFDGEEWLYYPTPKFDIAIIRATTADKDGNLSLEHESGRLDPKNVAMAVRAAGGKVIAQVKYISDTKLPAASVEVPGYFVDAVVESKEPEKYHRMTTNVFFDKKYCGMIDAPVDALKPLPLNVRKVIARRCAMELTPASLVNLGIGIPELVATVAGEEGFAQEMTLTSEDGIVGGMPGSGDLFGAGLNSSATVTMPEIFDIYNGGNLDLAVLGLAEVNQKGDNNVGKFGPKIPGCGGFINISQSTPKVVFCGAFTAGGSKYEIGNGELHIVQEGKAKKFVKEVQQVTYSGEYGASVGQKVLYVTERAVFELTKDGLMLIEKAPGVDLQKDILDQMEFTPIISPDLKEMDARIFREEKMGLTIG